MPSKSDLAYMTQLHYLIDRFDTDKATRKINRKLIKHGLNDYSVQSLNRGILHYKNKTDNSNVISVKGTNPLNVKDLISDVKLGLGFSKHDKQFRDRKNEIKRIYRNNTGENYITGHSLGGSIATNAIVRSKSIKDNTKQAQLFNTGYTPLFHNELTKGISKEDKKQLNKKIIQNHTKLDIISESLNAGSIGKVKTIGVASVNPLALHSLENFIDSTDLGE
jgi:hypothetical protein